jgi:hypothetical protein
MQLDGPKIDPAAYDTSVIDNDMNRVSGTSDANRADIGKPKTATEAGILQAMSAPVSMSAGTPTRT